MRPRLILIARALSAVARAALLLSALGLVLMTAFVAWQVFGRYVLNASPSWTEPAAIMLMSWFIFLGAAVGIREGYHLSFDVLLYVLPAGAKGWLHSLSDVAVIAFGAAMVWYGLQLAAGTWAATIPALGLPGGFDFLPVVAGGALVVIFSAERLARRAAGLPTPRFGESVEMDA
jgi:TRAP-type C4-dicarboxylate transport system permease small subunit